MSVAFQAGVAGRLDDVAETMRATHDALVRTWGRQRKGGISWKVYGGPMAGVIAANFARAKDTTPSGSIDDGFKHLEQLLGAGSEPTPDGYLEEMQSFAADEIHPTLVIAFCQVRSPRNNHPAHTDTRT